MKIVLFTRFSRPSGAQMAWRLCAAGIPPAAVIIEKRGKMISRRGGVFKQFSRMGFRFLAGRLLEALAIRLRFYLRKLLGRRFQDPRYFSIEEFLLDYPVPSYCVEDHNGEDAKDLLRRLNPDLGILTNTRKICKEVLEIPRHGFLNLHLSALPQYAGLDSIFWALYHGEREIGVTVHRAAGQIDRGDIVIQKKIRVSVLDDEKSLYEKALWLGTALMARSVRFLEKGDFPRMEQDLSKASYFSWPTPAQRRELRNRLKKGQWGTVRGAPLTTHQPECYVLHLITRMSRGGAQANTLATVRGLKELGYRPVLLTGPSWHPEGEILSEALEEGLEVVILSELERELRPLKDIFVFWKIWRMLGKFNFQMVHTHMSKAGWLGRYAAWLRKIPGVAHTPHGHVFHSYFPKWKEAAFLWLERDAARRCRALIALTDSERREHLELGVGRPEQWSVVPSGVSPERFAAPDPEQVRRLRLRLNCPAGRTIGYVGRLEPVKGPFYLIEAAVEIRKSFPYAHFLFVGDGRERSALESRVRELNLESRVTFAGDQNDVPVYLSLMDIVVVPSLNEGMGRVVAEAGLMSKAVIASRVGGIPDLIQHEKTGLLVEPRSAGEIADAVARLLKNSPLASQMGAELRARVLAGFTEERMVAQIHELYLGLGNKIGVASEPAFAGRY